MVITFPAMLRPLAVLSLVTALSAQAGSLTPEERKDLFTTYHASFRSLEERTEAFGVLLEHATTDPEVLLGIFDSVDPHQNESELVGYQLTIEVHERFYHWHRRGGARNIAPSLKDPRVEARLLELLNYNGLPALPVREDSSRAWAGDLIRDLNAGVQTLAAHLLGYSHSTTPAVREALLQKLASDYPSPQLLAAIVQGLADLGENSEAFTRLMIQHLEPEMPSYGQAKILEILKERGHNQDPQIRAIAARLLIHKRAHFVTKLGRRYDRNDIGEIRIYLARFLGLEEEHFKSTKGLHEGYGPPNRLGWNAVASDLLGSRLSPEQLEVLFNGRKIPAGPQRRQYLQENFFNLNPVESANQSSAMRLLLIGYYGENPCEVELGAE